jgi:hypothetical protein
VKSFADLTQTRRREDRAARVAPIAREASTLEQLQQALGNRALTQLLSPAPAPPSYTVTAEGIGTFKAKAFIGPERRTGGGAGRPVERQEPDKEPKESARFSFSIVLPMDGYTATLQFYEREGRHIPSLEVAAERSLRRIVLRFTDVLVVSFRPDTNRQETERLEEVGFEGSLDQKNSRF